MAGSLQGYKNSILAGMGNQNAQQYMQNETLGFNLLGNSNTQNTSGMNILSPSTTGDRVYDSNVMKVQALNQEVETGLGTRIDNVMSDKDKQTYLNGLTQSQYKQMTQYRDEGYGFMASKALLENSYKLSDPSATGLMKYKDYAEKDAYYYNNRNNKVSDFLEKYVSNPIGKLSNYWNNTLGYAEDAQKGNLSYVDRFANLTLGNIINGLDEIASGWVGQIDEAESKTKALYDKAIKGYDTDWDFYDKDREESIIDKAIDTAYGAMEAGLGVLGLLPNPKSFIGAAALSTKPGEFLGGITIDTLSKAVNLVLENTPIEKKLYDSLSDDSKQKLSTGLAMVIVGKVAKEGNAKIEARAEPYIKATQEMIRNGIEKAGEYAKVQRGVEEYQGTKNTPYIDAETGEQGVYSEFEGFKPGYRGRIASEAWEGFKEGVKEKFFRNDQPSLNGTESTTNPTQGPGTEKTTSGIGTNKTDTNTTQSDGIVNTIGTTQLRQWNKMNKVNGIKFVNRYGTDYGTWMAQRGFNQSYENNIGQLVSYAEYMQGQKAQALGTIKQRYSLAAVDDMLNEAISRAEYIKSEDLGKLQNLAIKNAEGGLTPSDIDYVRQWFGYNFPLKFDGTDVTGVVQRNNNMYERVKTVLEDIAEENGLSQLRDINREIAATHHIIEGTTRYYNGLATNDVISLKDLITLASTVANPKARPLFAVQQAIKVPKVKDAILNKLIKGKTNSERTQIKIDFDKIAKIQNEAERTRLLEEWIAKWNLKVEQATIGVDKVLPENVIGGGVEAGSKPFDISRPAKYDIKETTSTNMLLRAIINQLEEMNLVKGLSVEDAINYIKNNLSPESQAILERIGSYLANGNNLTMEDWNIIQKLADTIRQGQEEIKGVDKGGKDGYNNGDLATNQSQDEGQNGGQQKNGGDGTTGGDSTSSKGQSNNGTRQIATKDVDSIVDEIRKSGGISSYGDAVGEARTFVSDNRDAYAKVDSDGNISFSKTNGSEESAGDYVMLKAIGDGGNKIGVRNRDFDGIKFFERFGFKAIARDMDGNYIMAHNGDGLDVVKDNLGKYSNNPYPSLLPRMPIKKANKRVMDFIKGNKTSNIDGIEGWNGKSNYDGFGKKFDTSDKISNYVKDSFNYVDSNVSNDVFEVYNKILAETKQIYNGSIDNTDSGIVYEVSASGLRKRYGTDDEPTGLRSRKNRELAIGKEDGLTIPHEGTHMNMYKFGKELLGKDVDLSDFVGGLNRNLKPYELSKSGELVREFADLVDEIERRGVRDKELRLHGVKGKDLDYYKSPSERVARFGEAFVKFVKGGTPISHLGETFPTSLCVKYAKWLGKLDSLRVNGELSDGTLGNVDGAIKTYIKVDGVGTAFNTYIRGRKGEGVDNFDIINNFELGWQGSKAYFTQHSNDYMGSGEGAQVHGYGQYIAVSRDTANHYATELSSGIKFTIDGQPTKDRYGYTDAYNSLTDEQKYLFDKVVARNLNDYGFDEARDEVIEEIKNMEYELDNKIKESNSLIDYAQKNEGGYKEEFIKDFIDNERRRISEAEDAKKSISGKVKIAEELRARMANNRHLYKVEIPDQVKSDTPTGSNYIEEEGVLSQPGIDGIINKALDSKGIKHKPISEATMEDVKKLCELLYEDSYDRLDMESDGVDRTEYSKALNDRRNEFMLDVQSYIDKGKPIYEAILEVLDYRQKGVEKTMETLYKIGLTNDVLRYTGDDLYGNLTSMLGGQKNASEFLSGLGYDGIHYYGNRDGECYVVFDANNVKIISHESL